MPEHDTRTEVLDRPPSGSDEQPAHFRLPPWYEGRLWHGMSFPGWLRLLTRNHFAVGWRQLPAAVSITLFSLVNTLLAWCEWVRYGRQIAHLKLDREPLFILGHWRTGTTLLHELMAQDPRSTFPTTYQCFAPNHFLVSQWIVRTLFPFLLPRERPMDRMRMDFDRPQEDEVALCNLGLPSTFLTVAFPNRPPQDPAYLNLDSISSSERHRWQRTWLWFLRRVTFRRPGRLVLKSPQHTCRLPLLLEVFPQAKFVYLVRDPIVVFRSTVHLWKSLYSSHGLQQPVFAGLDEEVLATFDQMHERIESTRQLVPEGNFYTVRYEDLIADPVGELRRLYAELNLGDFAPAEPGVLRYLAETVDYRTNRYEANPERDAIVRQRWAKYAARHGYV